MLNNCTLMGRLTHNPELKTTENSDSIVKFSIAVTHFKSTSNGEKEVSFIDCIGWKKTAEFIHKYFRKGDPIIVIGKLRTRQYENKEGVKKKICEVVVNEVNFCAFKKNEEQNTESNLFDVSNEDLPF